jgi:thiol:disulfide interchange protein DsbD
MPFHVSSRLSFQAVPDSSAPMQGNPQALRRRGADRRQSSLPRERVGACRLYNSMIRLPSMRAAWALLAVLLTVVVSGPARAADDFLDPDKAFTLSVRVLDAKRLELDYKAAPGYYLYRERFKFTSPDAKLGEPQIPPGKKHYDTALEQNVETYHDGVVVILPVESAGKSFTLNATHQGCADKGLCYPPQPRTLAVTMKGFGADADSVKPVAEPELQAPAGVNPPVTGQAAGGMSVAPGALPDPLRSVKLADGSPATPQVDRAPQGGAPTILAPAAASSADATAPAAAPRSATLEGRFLSALNGGGAALILLLAFPIGLLLSLTPCVLPMLPILSSIIVGQGSTVTRGRGLLLATSYSLGVALVYVVLGIAAALVGHGLSAFLQNPVVLVSFGVLLLLLSLSMFGVYELQLPSALRDRLTTVNAGLTGGQLGGVFAMGVLSALIVSPCITAPLSGVLLFIANTGSVALGGTVLFLIAAGMSVPLLVAGASAGELLPRAGAWMERVKQLFGLLLIAVAFYIAGPVLPHAVPTLAYGALLIMAATTVGAFDALAAATNVNVRLAKGFGLVLAAAGVLLLYQVLVGPAAGAGGVSAASIAAPHFDRVTSVAELDQRLQSAGRPVMLDFYADWCVSCKEMEAQTFVDPAIRAKLDKAVLLRADVTANSADDKALLQRFHLFGPPGIILFDAQGHEIESVRVVGFQDAERFSASLASAGL